MPLPYTSDIYEICEAILTSKKYTTLYKPMVLRICEEEYPKYANDKERIKGIKNTLHAMYGAYVTPDIYKKANKLLDTFITEQQESEKQAILNKILSLHASTKERMRHLSAFYDFIFDTIGPIESVLDIGCGFNPFTLSYFHKNTGIISKYYALDIDNRISDLNNRYFTSLGMPALASCADVAADTPRICADTAFLFKLLPLIERQSKGRSAKLLKEIKAKYLVVTYPTKSLSGKKKGMPDFYSAAFEDVMEEIGQNISVCVKQEIGNELVYVLVKKSFS